MKAMYYCSIFLILTFTGYSFSISDAKHPTVSNISTVYLVSSCHLDVGFADTAVNIVNEYFDKYFPATMEVVQELYRMGVNETLVFTTHPFLVYLYFNCYKFKELGLHCPSSQDLDMFTAGVISGHITWHAFPFNSEMEFYDKSLANFGFEVTHQLDKMFARKPTITMSQRDVPGTTRSLIPLLVSNGVQAITVGVNTVSMPPAVPSVFRWQDPISKTEVLAMWHPHGYGGSSGPSLDSVVTVPGMPVALAFAIRGDNSGPPIALEVLRNYGILRKMFPGARIIASGYDAFVTELVKYKSLLPVYNEEIGDTWIQGVASDPWKTAVSRLAMRLRSGCLDSGRCSMSDNRFVAFSMMLLKSGEHTWGKDIKHFLGDTTNWSNREFHPLQYTNSNFIDVTNSWIEQRLWGNSYPLELLGNHSLRTEIEKAMTELKFDGTIDTEGYKLLDNISTIVMCGGIEMQLSNTTGSIVHLVDKRNPSKPVVYADSSHQLAEINYKSFLQGDYSLFFDEYFYDFGPAFAKQDFGKPGFNSTLQLYVSLVPRMLWYKEDTSSCSLLLNAVFDNSSLVVSEFGGAKEIWTLFTVPKTSSPSKILTMNFTAYFVNKTSTRIPESIYLYFNPLVSDPTLMSVSKLGEYVNVLDVMKNGSKHLHGSDSGIVYDGGPSFYALDSCLVCIGTPTPFPTPMEQPDVTKGFSFDLINNIWGTNYIMWYPYKKEDSSIKFNFQITLPPSW